jgi:hypothetical protein
LVSCVVRRHSPIKSDVVLVGGDVVVQHGDLQPRRARASGRAGVGDDLGLVVDEAEDPVGLVTAHALEDGAACRADLVVGARAKRNLDT